MEFFDLGVDGEVCYLGRALAYVANTNTCGMQSGMYPTSTSWSNIPGGGNYHCSYQDYEAATGKKWYTWVW